LRSRSVLYCGSHAGLKTLGLPGINYRNTLPSSHAANVHPSPMKKPQQNQMKIPIKDRLPLMSRSY
jgi:hypothetical protein